MAKGDKVLHPTNRTTSGSIKHTGGMGKIEGPRKTKLNPSAAKSK